MFLPDSSICESIFSCAVVLASAFGAGTLIRRKGDFISFAAGFALLSFAGWLFPSLSNRVISVTLSLLIYAGAAYGVFQICRTAKEKYRIYIAGAVMFLAAAGSYLIPPYSWDECVYQTALLKQYVENGNYAVLADNPFSAFPSLAHSTMRLGLELCRGNLYLPRILSGAILVITMTVMLKTIFRTSGKTGTLIFAAALISPVTLVLARANYVEQYILFFGTAGALSIWKLRRYPVKCAFYASLFAAASLCVKLTGAGVVLALAAFYLLTVPKKKFALQCAVSTGAFVLFILPFFLRPYLATGNPFYPFAAGVFTSDVSLLEVSRYHHLLGSYRYGLGAVSGIALGWLFAAFDAKIFDGITANWQFPAMVLFCAAGTYCLYRQSSRRFKIAGSLLLSCAVCHLFWALSSQQTRFLLPLLWLLTVTATFILKGMNKKQAVICSATILICGCISFPVDHLKHFVTAWRIQKFIRQDSRRFLISASRDTGYFEVVDYLKTTPEKSKVLLLLNERRTLYMPRKCTIGEPFFQPLNTPVPENAEKLWKNIKGFDYIVTSASGHNPDIQKSTVSAFVHIASMLDTLSKQQQIQMVFADKRGEYLIFRCGESATGSAF